MLGVIHFDEKGIVPVVVQDELSGEVRMVAYANAEAVAKTRETGKATFYSRSRQELWEKGKTSGNAIAVSRILVDCDEDCLIYLATPLGPSCHTGQTSCFFRDVGGEPATAAPLLTRLEAIVEERKSSTTEKSYTKSLYEKGVGVIGDKVREEADELAVALESETDERVVQEAADVIFHLLVGLKARDIGWRRVLAVLASRNARSGLAEKASRTPG
jgi:phosphoribosyl-ATP pyrophosphohydrolase/phosphoribosyl-AMP cyclohydrolase